MIPIVDYFFYKIEKFGRFLELDISPLTALTSFTLIEFFDINIILNILNIKIPIIKTQIIIGVLGLLFLNYLLFLMNKRYLKIRDKFDKENKLRKNIGSIFVIIFIVITIFFAFYRI